jgi:sensor histidine kinase YesM
MSMDNLYTALPWLGLPLFFVFMTYISMKLSDDLSSSTNYKLFKFVDLMSLVFAFVTVGSCVVFAIAVGPISIAILIGLLVIALFVVSLYIIFLYSKMMAKRYKNKRKGY